jgi:hypothetical protein
MKESKTDNAQENILKEHRSRQKIQIPEFEPQLNQFVLSNGRTVRLKEIDCLYKKAIFKGLNYSNYLINYTDEVTASRDCHFKKDCINFIDFINQHKLSRISNTNLLKAFEAFRVANDIKPQSTGVTALRTNFRDILSRDNFTAVLTSSELDWTSQISLDSL